jgi:hypothetical protein
VTLDWNNIRPFNGDQSKAFEELCAQLARAECPLGSTFVRKGTPDAGVECYAILNDGAEWGWQSKYVDGLGDSQWSQIDESINRALEKHPRLVRYFVCVPVDRADARIDGRKSAKDRWDDHVTKWSKWASDRGMNLDFTYWGSHELIELLTRPEHIGRVHFWFEVRGFDAPWFTARLDEALQAAGPRYTPEVHVDLPIAWEFEAFGRTDCFFDREKVYARRIREKLRAVELSDGAAEPALDAALSAVSSKVQAVLTGLGAVNTQSTGPLPFKAILETIRAAEEAAEELSRLARERERDMEAKKEQSDAKAPPRFSRSNLFRDRQIRLDDLTSELWTARESLLHADDVAGRALMLLSGDAGTGKTHLLCDVARQRSIAGRPTVLLMGQRFMSQDAPWHQAIQQLDLAGLSVEKFVGALEAAAQAAGSRALLMIDAINEGAGRAIWPSHLAAFLAQVERSPWIGVVLAVRSSYEEIVVPAAVRSRAVTVTHPGFMDHEYDATKTFFVYYGLEFPSTPLLAPEFRNPLFLKTLCQGLSTKGERRLPRGFQGITAVFDLYLGAVNGHLAEELGFDRRIPKARQALDAVAEAIFDSGESWVTLAKAGDIVNAFLPGRDFERSLYRGLVVEGVLVEEAAGHNDDGAEEVVFLAYERLGDHLAAKTLLDRHLGTSGQGSAFAQGGPLGFICDVENCVSPGLLEALCIQIPERTGQELISIAPACAGQWGLGDAFRQSIVWRKYAAFSDRTREALNELCRSEHDKRDTLEALLTVATLPGHPLNARFLDERLRKAAMPDRDAWWSVYLHRAWGTRGAVDRLVDWASSLAPNMSIDDDAVDLCAITLAWMLTTSNRFLRDRATKALVALLTGRLMAVVRLVEQLADVDDPYVVERVYAVAYGVAMRCHDPAAVGALANCAYGHVFASGNPPPHILLRDYARGVVERALHLGSAIDVGPDRIRPPYKSIWPTIPSEKDIKPLMPDWSKGSHDSGELGWGRNRIGSSVMDDDFARYVIGTNSSSSSSHWLSLRLEQPPWYPPPRLDVQLRSFVDELSAEERKEWERFEVADRAYELASSLFFRKIVQGEMDGISGDLGLEAIALEVEKARPPEFAVLEEKRKQAVADLEAVLTEGHAQRLKEIWGAKETAYEARQPPGFELRQIQRFVLWRVFNLGWTTERFGHFDRFDVSNDGRAASKAERIGKKYQWIAYHEIMAHISDHFQYRDRLRDDESDHECDYQGPWQEYLREIDPSCTIKSPLGGTSWKGHAAAWWEDARYDSWGESESHLGWVLNCDDSPKIEKLLVVNNPADGARWLNGEGFFSWQQRPPADQDSTDVERRELWYMCTGYLLREDDAESFLSWAKGVDFWGRWMPKAAEVYRIFLGEHGWAPASRYFRQPYYGDDGWTQPNYGCPVRIRSIAFEYLQEAKGVDCSIDQSYALRLPVNDLLAGLGIQWSGSGADFIDAAGRVVVYDPTVYSEGPSALLLREDLLREFLVREKLTICWAVLGEKRVLSARGHHPALRMSGAYVYSEGLVRGFIKRLEDDPNQ